MRKLLIATGNKGKFPEIVAKLKGLPFEMVSLMDMAIPEGFEVEESAMTFEGNALIKAFTWAKKFNVLTVAEDAGLEVDALDGRPGVFSARYAPGSDADRRVKLLDELKDVPDEKRTARFRAVVAICDPQNDKVRTCEGAYEGRIIHADRGTNGFGYDPIFLNEQLNKTNAEMTLEEKNAVSHRGKAFEKARKILAEEFAGQAQ